MFPNNTFSDLVRALCAPCAFLVPGSALRPCALVTFPGLVRGWPCASLVRALCVPCAYLVRTLCLTVCATCPGTRSTYLVRALARHKPLRPCAQGGGAGTRSCTRHALKTNCHIHTYILCTVLGKQKFPPGGFSAITRYHRHSWKYQDRWTWFLVVSRSFLNPPGPQGKAKDLYFRTRTFKYA